jgi:hypothetical protein
MGPGTGISNCAKGGCDSLPNSNEIEVTSGEGFPRTVLPWGCELVGNGAGKVPEFP